MKKFPIEKQLDYYLVGMTYVHPPRMGLADEIASQGKYAIPYLVQRLQEEKEDRNREDIIYIFREISLFHYDLRDDEKVLAALTQTISTMKEPWKQQAEESLKAIMERPIADPAKKMKEIRDELKKSQWTPSQ